MDLRAAAIHIAICVCLGGLIYSFTPAKWLAASFWTSAALFLNGSIAICEDSLSGGFENPDGTNTPAFIQGWGAVWFAIRSLAVTAALASAGFAIQFL